MKLLKNDCSSSFYLKVLAIFFYHKWKVFISFLLKLMWGDFKINCLVILLKTFHGSMMYPLMQNVDLTPYTEPAPCPIFKSVN